MLRIASSTDFALYMNQKIHDAERGTGGGVDFICSTILGVARQQALRKVLRVYTQCLRLVNLALNLEEYWMIPQVVLRVAQALPPVFMHLWGAQLEKTASLLKDNVGGLLTKTVAISFALKDWDNMAQLVYCAFTANSQKDKQHYQETYAWAFKTLNGIPNECTRKLWLEHLEPLTK